MQRRIETETELWCGKCRTMHDKSDFCKDKNSPSGFAYACKKVISLRNRETHTKSRDKINLRHVELRAMRKLSPDADVWAAKKLLQDARFRASKRGLSFDLSLEDIISDLPEICPALAIPLVYQSAGKRVPGSASLDRIDSRGGYTKGNIWIISWRANQIKNDATPDEMIAVANAVLKKVENR